MNTNNNQQIKKRIFSLACRKGTAILTDSKLGPNGKGTFKKFESDNSQLSCIKALNDLLTRMPQGVKFDYAIAILLPESINFLAYEDTRNYWIANGCKKNGEVIEESILEEVKTLHNLLKVHASNIQMFNQKKLTSPIYKSYSRATWNTINELIPVEKQEVASSYDF